MKRRAPKSKSPRLLHYSPTPITEVRSAPDQSKAMTQRSALKPDGFWVSVEGPDDWVAWCEAEHFRLPKLEIVHEVVLRPRARILRICGVAAFDNFHVRYCTPMYPGADRLEAIRWDLVAAEYQGIVIAPYLWQRRLDGPIWYYGWDCASGCIWDASAIARIEVLK